MSKENQLNQLKEIKEIKEKKPKNITDTKKKRKSRTGFTLHTNALLYLLLKKGWTIKVTKTKKAKVTMQNYKCIELSREMEMIEERLNESDLNELSSQFDELVKVKEIGEDKKITLEATDLIPNENSSETVSEE